MSMPEPNHFDFAETEIPPGLSLLDASAGTGKTFNLTHLAAAFLLDGSVERVSELLIVTFTNDAAREIMDRIRAVLGRLGDEPAEDEALNDPGIARLRAKFLGKPAASKRLARAVLEMDQIQVSTIHSFCQRTLQTEGTLCGLASMPELITDDSALLEESLRDLWQTRLANDSWLSAIALVQGWSPESDLATLRAARALDQPRWEPEPANLEEALSRLQSAVAKACEPSLLPEVLELVSNVEKWNKDHSSSQASELLNSLSRIDRNEVAALLKPILEITLLPKAVNARSKAGKSSSEALANCALVRACVAVRDEVGGLRWSWQHACAQLAGERATQALLRNRQITQDGLIRTLHRALHSPGTGELLAKRLSERFRIAMIDESQDTDPWQFSIFERIFLRPGEERRLLLIGDPKQAIYGFRGADLETYLRAGRAAKARFHLTRTYRAPEPLVQVVNGLFRPEGALLHPELPFKDACSGMTRSSTVIGPGGKELPRLTAWIQPDLDNNPFSSAARRAVSIPGIVASEIVRLLSEARLLTQGKDSEEESRSLTPGDFAVLVQAHYQGEQIAEALRLRGVPAILASGEDVMASDEATELLTVLRAINEPRRLPLRKAALGTRLLGLGITELSKLDRDAGNDEAWLARFEDWGRAWQHQGMASMLGMLDREMGLTLRLSQTPEGERRVTNIRHLSDLLQHESSLNGPNPERLIRWMGGEILRARDGKAVEERQLQLESDSHAVQIVTMHKAKGLEYNLVFCPYLWVSREVAGIQALRASSERAEDRLVDCARAEANTQAYLNQRALEERLRLTYVALTRAREALWILGGDLARNRRGTEAPSALDWLLREEKIRTEDFAGWLNTATATRGERHRRRLLERLGGTQDGTVLVVEPPTSNPARWTPPGETRPSLQALAARQPAPAWTLTSFSNLAQDGEHRPSPARRQTGQEEQQGNSFLGAAAGTAIGTALHAVLEAWDFGSPNQELVSNCLRQVGLPPPPPGQPPTEAAVLGLLPELRAALLPGTASTLAEACRETQASEWHFHLPLRPGFGPRQLAAVFGRHASPGLEGYASMLDTLNASGLAGYLHGFIDRIAVTGTAWGVIDWKTNRLGSTQEEYSNDALLRCAMESHYVLQMHLYLVALRRYLSLRGGPPLAGAWLVFLRAVRAGTSEGVLHINPSPAMLDELDGLFMNAPGP